MNEINKWTDENIKFVEKAIELRNRGYYIESSQLVTKYNEILNKHHAFTSCGSCLKIMINELESALNQYKKQAELSGLTTSELSVELDIVEEQMEDVKNKIKTKKNKKK